jgi:hypothetical protein
MKLSKDVKASAGAVSAAAEVTGLCRAGAGAQFVQQMFGVERTSGETPPTYRSIFA